MALPELPNQSENPEDLNNALAQLLVNFSKTRLGTKLFPYLASFLDEETSETGEIGGAGGGFPPLDQITDYWIQ